MCSSWELHTRSLPQPYDELCSLCPAPGAGAACQVTAQPDNELELSGPAHKLGPACKMPSQPQIELASHHV
jgi:hypothetical protein